MIGTFGQQFAELLCSIKLHVNTVTVQATHHVLGNAALHSKCHISHFDKCFTYQMHSPTQQMLHPKINKCHISQFNAQPCTANVTPLSSTNVTHPMHSPT